MNTSLAEVVQNWIQLILPLSNADLEKPWPWNGYNEGVRFACLRVIEELRTLAARLRTERTQKDQPLTEAQLILGNYHSAYRDLQAALLGVSAEDIARAPAEGEWPIRETYAHILGADLGFRAAIRYALEGHRAGTWIAESIPEHAYPRLFGLSEAEYDALLGGPFAPMTVYHADLHTALLHEFAKITAEELDQPAAFWEETRFPTRFRLHRFESHLRQHTIQVDKTLVMLNQPPTEVKRLLRLTYAAWADAENALIGAAAGFGEKIIGEHAEVMIDISGQIAKVLKH
jgi:hypothetical protein